MSALQNYSSSKEYANNAKPLAWSNQFFLTALQYLSLLLLQYECILDVCRSVKDFRMPCQDSTGFDKDIMLFIIFFKFFLCDSLTKTNGYILNNNIIYFIKTIV